MKTKTIHLTVMRRKLGRAYPIWESLLALRNPAGLVAESRAYGLGALLPSAMVRWERYERSATTGLTLPTKGVGYGKMRLVIPSAARRLWRKLIAAGLVEPTVNVAAIDNETRFPQLRELRQFDPETRRHLLEDVWKAPPAADQSAKAYIIHGRIEGDTAIVPAATALAFTFANAHGGARPNTGGARPGAGRPRKALK